MKKGWETLPASYTACVKNEDWFFFFYFSSASNGSVCAENLNDSNLPAQFNVET
jgi:hypothetical protein